MESRGYRKKFGNKLVVKVAALLILTVLISGCLGLGKKLGYNDKVIPTASLDLIDINPNSALAVTEEIEFSEVSFPNYLWTPELIKLKESALSLVDIDDNAEGVITVSVLMNEHPVSAWEITVSNGSIHKVDAGCVECTNDESLNISSDNVSVIPGVNLSSSTGRTFKATIERKQREWMHEAYTKLAEEDRPEINNEMESIIIDQENLNEDQKRAIFSVVANGLKDKNFKLTVIAHTLDEVEAQLLIQNLEFRIFDSGQGLLGLNQQREIESYDSSN